MAKVRETTINQRRAQRESISVPLRLRPAGRAGEVLDGETIDVSWNGIGVKLRGATSVDVDTFLEQLVEEGVPVEVTLRLPEGSVRTEGQLMWWGLLGAEVEFNIRAGILMQQGWSEEDWALIEKNLDTD